MIVDVSYANYKPLLRALDSLGANGNVLSLASAANSVAKRLELTREFIRPHWPQPPLPSSHTPPKLDFHFVTQRRPNMMLTSRVGNGCRGVNQWFRSITGMSPLQYQKQVRLQEARSILRNERKDAGTVSRRVGYESPSQFSREYSRLFGNPPVREISKGNLSKASPNDSFLNDVAS